MPFRQGEASHANNRVTLRVPQSLGHKDVRLGAALSYYSVFSIGPLILIAIAVAGLLFGQDAVRGGGRTRGAQAVFLRGRAQFETEKRSGWKKGVNKA